MDDATLQAILDRLPAKPAGRSKLEPYARLIQELRRRNRSYREIAQVLQQECGLTVGTHTVYNFVQVRSQDKVPGRSVPRGRKVVPERTAAAPAPPSPPAAEVKDNRPGRNAVRPPPPAARARGAEKVFHYDENEPLRLLPPETTRK